MNNPIEEYIYWSSEPNFETPEDDSRKGFAIILEMWQPECETDFCEGIWIKRYLKNLGLLLRRSKSICFVTTRYNNQNRKESCAS